MFTISYFQNFMASHAEIIYLIIILGVIAEGEIIVILAGIFSHLGTVNIFYAFLATILGGVIKSIMGYSFGYYLQKNHSENKFIYQTENRINNFLPKFLKRQYISIFLSRFLVLGVYWFALIYAGYKKIQMKVFIKAEAASLVIWAMVMLSLGYFFSYTALSVSDDMRKFFGIILVFFIGFFILEKIIAFVIKLFEVKLIKE